MKQRARLILAAGALAVIGCQDATRPDDVEGPLLSRSQGQVVPNQYIVLFTDGVADPASAARGLARAHGLTLRHVYGTAVKGFAGTIPAARLDAVRSDPRVVLVEPERAYELDFQTLPTGIDRIEADQRNAGGVTVDLDVGILDSGIDEDHPDLNVAGGINFSGGPARNWDDRNGHGTHTAGTVGAIDNGFGVVGVAPGVRLHAVKVCKNGGICFTGDMVAGIDWMAARKADGSINFAAANMSISTSDDENACTVSSGAVHRAICGLVNEGVVFALSAGNNGRVKNAFPEVIAVSAIADFDGKGGGLGSPTCRSDVDETLANFSNFGPEVDIAAPGVCILSTWNDGGTNTISGTSMASPHVAGAVALYLSANGLPPATDSVGVNAIEAAIIGAALLEGTANDACSYNNERGSHEPLLFVNGTAFGGTGSCDDGTGGGPSNTAPTADDKTVSTDEDTQVTVTLTASDPEECELTFSIVDGPVSGTLSGITDKGCTTGTPNADAADVTYTPTPDFNGSDSFTYRASDGTPASNVATVSITINAVNDAPVANDDAASTTKDQLVTIDVLANDSDVDADALSVTGASDPLNGTATVNDDNTITYTPGVGFTGEDSFTYDISDGNLTDQATVTVTVSEPSAGVTVTGIDPNTMQAGTTIDVTITGSGFAAGADVTFENGRGPAPTASDVVFDDATNSITATITAKSGGPGRNRVWDVRVTNSDSSSGVLAGGFTVTP